MPQPPVSVSVIVVTPQEVVAVGLRTMLQSASAPFDIRTSGQTEDEPAVVLYDVIHMGGGDDSGLDYWLWETASIVIAINRTLRPELGARAKAHGVEWAIDLGITTDALVAVIRDAVAGNLEENPAAQEWRADAHLGVDHGLSRRESQVLGLVARGLGNQEIADTLYLSINSVKTYIRNTYRKVGVATRAQAVVWALQNGYAATDLPTRHESGTSPVLAKPRIETSGLSGSAQAGRANV